MTKSPVEILVSKYNAINGLNINPNDVSLGPVFTISDQEYNTSVDIVPNANSIWLTTRKVFYRRVTLAEALAVPSEVRTTGNEYLYQILDAVNAAYGLHLKEADVEDAVIQYSNPANPLSAGTVTLTARPSSYFYTGSKTITVNTVHRLGNNLYENELSYVVIERSIEGVESPASVKVLNNYGQPVTDFTFFSNLTFTADISIYGAWKLNNDTILFLGRFPAVVGGMPVTYRAIVTDLRGFAKITMVGQVFALSRGSPSMHTFICDPDTAHVYLIDAGNIVGGRTSLLHRYQGDGSYDSSFPNLTTMPVISLAVTQDRLYFLTGGNNQVSLMCVDKTTLQVPPGWNHVVFSGAGLLNNAQVVVDNQGPRVCVDFASLEGVWGMSINGQSVMTTGGDSPSLVFGFTANGVLRADWKKMRTALWSQIKKVYPFAVTAQGNSFCAIRTDAQSLAYPKFEVVCVDEEGNYHKPGHGPFGSHPLFQEPPRLFAGPNADIIAVGEALREVQTNGGLVPRSVMAVYSSATGRFASTIYVAEGVRRIFGVLILIGEDDV